jgi:hypothetical protein
MNMKEGDGASNVLTAMQGEKSDKISGEDDEIKYIKWMKEKNMIKGMNIREDVGEKKE